MKGIVLYKGNMAVKADLAGESGLAGQNGENIHTEDYKNVSREHIQPIVNELRDLRPELQH